LNKKFTSVLNLRDIGGVSTYSGTRIKSGFVFRSANPDSINKREALQLKNELGVTRIIDLRAKREKTKTSKNLKDFELVSLPIDFEGKTRERLMPVLRKRNCEDIIADISNQLYLEMLDASSPVVKNVFELILSQSQGSILIHCQAGKDRTGLIAALIQMMMGADKEVIIDEYMKSNNELLQFFKRRLFIRKMISFGIFPSDNILYAITLRRRNIESVIGRINEKYGGIDSYLVSAGFEQRKIGLLRDKLAEK